MATVAETLSSANDLLASHSALLSRIRSSQRSHRAALRALPAPPTSLLALPLIPSPPASPPPSPPSPTLPQAQPANKRPPLRPDLPPAKRARAQRYKNYIPEEETIRNDYSQRYVDGGEWPQNWVLGAEPARRFEEYPKQQRLLALKKASVAQHATPPFYLPLSPGASSSSSAGVSGGLSALAGAKFDAILIDPPFSSTFGWRELQDMPIPTLAADPSFVFLWVGSGAGDGLERGREVLARWGYRRCEDVCWLRTNAAPGANRGPGTDAPTTSLLTRTKQHCLIGIRGTVRRSTDAWFVHCNVDTDVIVWEGERDDPTAKPPEMYTLVENFCLGTRRLEIFARARRVRRGWVSLLAEGEETKIAAVIEQAKRAPPPPSPIPSPAILAAPLPTRPQTTHLTPSGSASSSVLPQRSPLPTQAQLPNPSPNLAHLSAPALLPLPPRPPQPALTNWLGEDVTVGAAQRWERDTWEARIRELARGEQRAVVPMTPEIDALRPKSPVRGGGGQPGGPGGGGGGGGGSGIGQGGGGGNGGMRGPGGQGMGPAGVPDGGMFGPAPGMGGFNAGGGGGGWMEPMWGDEGMMMDGGMGMGAGMGMGMQNMQNMQGMDGMGMMGQGMMPGMSMQGMQGMPGMGMQGMPGMGVGMGMPGMGMGMGGMGAQGMGMGMGMGGMGAQWGGGGGF